MLFRPTRAISDNPLHALWHAGHGRLPDWINGHDGEIAWLKRDHRGVQWLDRIQLPRKPQHLKYILQPRFEIRFDTAFEQVLRACADPQREGKTWICDELYRAYRALHEMGFAHSFEAWDGERLVGGAFGLQLGSIMSIDSVFHRASNAGIAVYGQTLLRLRERGFKLVDVNYVSESFARFGEEWVPQWRFEQLLRQYMRERPSLCDDRPAPRLPFKFRVLLPISRRIERLADAVRSPYTPSIPSASETNRSDAATAAAAAQRPRTPLGVG
jgi:leucyl/phenylalanyl-tRNA--protein transferase